MPSSPLGSISPWYRYMYIIISMSSSKEIKYHYPELQLMQAMVMNACMQAGTQLTADGQGHGGTIEGKNTKKKKIPRTWIAWPWACFRADTCSCSAKHWPNNSQKNNYFLVQLKVLKQQTRVSFQLLQKQHFYNNNCTHTWLWWHRQQKVHVSFSLLKVHSNKWAYILTHWDLVDLLLYART